VAGSKTLPAEQVYDLRGEEPQVPVTPFQRFLIRNSSFSLGCRLSCLPRQSEAKAGAQRKDVPPQTHPPVNSIKLV
jgi:hypothetical protein